MRLIEIDLQKSNNQQITLLDPIHETFESIDDMYDFIHLVLGYDETYEIGWTSDITIGSTTKRFIYCKTYEEVNLPSFNLF